MFESITLKIICGSQRDKITTMKKMCCINKNFMTICFSRSTVGLDKEIEVGGIQGKFYRIFES
jgi:hypothetical protein